MIAAWMAYAMLLAGCAGAAAAALEPVVQGRGWPRRWLWAAAVAVSLMIPVAMAVRSESPQSALDAGASLDLSGSAAPVDPLEPMRSSRALDLTLVALWGAATLLLLGSLSLGAWQLRRVRAGARRVVLDGEVVAVTGDLGPGATLFGSPRIIVPEWIAVLDRRAVHLLVSHEREHIRAGDPALLLCAVGALVLMPWNPALWWCVRRLRAAMEIDCDARVLARENDVRSYGELLLDVAGRRARQPLAAYLTFADSSSPLERRISAMTDIDRPLSRVRRATLGAFAVLAVIVACETKRPAPLAPVTDYVLEEGGTRARRTQEGPVVTAGEPRARFALDAAIAKYFPNLAANGGSDQPLMFIVDDQSKVLWARIVERSPGGSLSAAPGDIPVPNESIDWVEVVKQRDALPSGVRGGVIMIGLKRGAQLSRTPSGGRTLAKPPEPRVGTPPEVDPSSRPKRTLAESPDGSSADPLVVILDANDRVLFSQHIARSPTGAPGAIPAAPESIQSVDVIKTPELLADGTRPTTIRIKLKAGARLLQTK